LISNFNSDTRSNLVFPLSGHNFSVGSRNVDSSVEASLVVSVSNAATKGSVGTDRAVVGSLSSRVTIVGPSEGIASEFGRGGKESIFLFNSVPGELLKIRVPNLVGEVSEVSVSGDELLVGGVFPHVGLTEDHDVVSLSEGIAVVSDGLEVNLRVFGSSHVARRTIKVPHR